MKKRESIEFSKEASSFFMINGAITFMMMCSYEAIIFDGYEFSIIWKILYTLITMIQSWRTVVTVCRWLHTSAIEKLCEARINTGFVIVNIIILAFMI